MDVRERNQESCWQATPSSPQTQQLLAPATFTLQLTTPPSCPAVKSAHQSALIFLHRITCATRLVIPTVLIIHQLILAINNYNLRWHLRKIIHIRYTVAIIMDMEHVPNFILIILQHVIQYLIHLHAIHWRIHLHVTLPVLICQQRTFIVLHMHVHAKEIVPSICAWNQKEILLNLLEELLNSLGNYWHLFMYIHF